MFESISLRRPKLNKFDLSHDYKLSCNMGELIPILTEEVVPGDRFRVRSEILMRLAPMLAPVMHRVDVYTHYFFVPNRLLWSSWEDFITGGPDGTLAPVWPHFNMDYIFFNVSHDTGSLYDYLGLPPISAQPAPGRRAVSALPFRAYAEIYNEYYRDQTLIPEVQNPKTSGAQSDVECTVLRRRAWEKDYFTSALPFAQRGGPVSIPVQLHDVTRWKDAATGDDLTVAGTTPDQFFDLGTHVELRTDPQGEAIRIDNIEGIDVNDLRRSTAIQRWLELAARGGSRYAEQLLTFFGVRSSDARLMRPEYLGGGKQNVMISEVLQTSETATGTPQGNMAGHGISVGTTNSFSRRFEEHGIVMGIMSVLPRTSYEQGIHRMWMREDKFDYYWPQFAHLGEQGIKEDEIFFGPASTSGDDDWGYQSRYAEYKHRMGRVAGDFRTDLDYWHLCRQFPSTPGLNKAFVEANPSHRIFANTEPTDHKLWVQVYHQFSALRPMPYYANPHL